MPEETYVLLQEAPLVDANFQFRRAGSDEQAKSMVEAYVKNVTFSAGRYMLVKRLGSGHFQVIANVSKKVVAGATISVEDTE